jgi:c-di-GMP-binding flagellar brake protein YcgR
MEAYEERRECVRMPSSAEVEVKKGRRKAVGRVVDISPAGCQLVSDVDLDIGDFIKILFALNPNDPSVEIRGEIRWTKKEANSPEKRYGIQFKEREKFERLGPLFLDYLAFKKKMELLRKEKKEKN